MLILQMAVILMNHRSCVLGWRINFYCDFWRRISKERNSRVFEVWNWKKFSWILLIVGPSCTHYCSCLLPPVADRVIGA